MASGHPVSCKCMIAFSRLSNSNEYKKMFSNYASQQGFKEKMIVAIFLENARLLSPGLYSASISTKPMRWESSNDTLVNWNFNDKLSPISNLVPGAGLIFSN